MIQFFDKNGNYWLEFEDTQWCNSNNDEPEKAICIDIRSTPDCKDGHEVPEETQFMMSVKEAKYLHAWLSVFLQNND